MLATDLGRHMTYVERLNEMAMLEGARSHGTRVNSSKERRGRRRSSIPRSGRDLVAAVALKFADLGHACKKRICMKNGPLESRTKFGRSGAGTEFECGDLALV